MFKGYIYAWLANKWKHDAFNWILPYIHTRGNWTEKEKEQVRLERGLIRKKDKEGGIVAKEERWQGNKRNTCFLSRSLPSAYFDTPSNSIMSNVLKITQIFLILSLIKITYIKECVRIHQGFHLFYNEVNTETQWLPQQCKWRPNDILQYLNKVIAITLRYSNEDRCFELSALNSLLLLQNIWKRWRRIDFGIIQGCSL